MGGAPAIHLPYSITDDKTVQISEMFESPLHKQALQNCTHRSLSSVVVVVDVMKVVGDRPQGQCTG